MPTEQEALSDYVRRKVGRRTYREISENAKRAGFPISTASISDIISGNTKEIKSGTIMALAKGLDVPEVEILAIVRGRPVTPEERANLEKDRLWEMYSDIPRQCQQDVLDLLAVLQRNHSISARREHADRRRVVASAGRVPQGAEAEDRPRTRPEDVTGPTRLATPVSTLPLAEGEDEDVIEQPAARAINKQQRNGS